MGLEPTRVMLLSGLANRRVYQFRHISERTLPAKQEHQDLNPERRFWRPACYRLHHAPPCCLHTGTLMPEAGIEPTCSTRATTGLQSAADPFGLSGVIRHSYRKRVRQIERAGGPSFTLERPAHPKIPVVITVLEFLGSGKPLPRVQTC